MPLFLPTPCKVCGTGHPWPADARFCRNCGRPANWSETARGRVWAGVAVGAGLVAVALLVVLGLLAARQVSQTSTPPVAAVPVPARPTPSVGPTGPTLTTMPSFMRPATDPTPPPPAAVVATVPTPAGDVDLSADPSAAYAGGPPADRLTVHGLRIGLPLSAVPVAMLDDSAPDHLRDTGGNLYAVDDGRIGEVHVRDADLLARWPIDSTADLVARFGRPADVYTGEGNEAFPTYLYPARGLHVRWDNAAGRVIELVLVRPAPPPPSVAARPGDTDLATDPLAAYAGGPSADHLTVHGLGVGVAVSAVPPALVAERTAGHFRDAGGDVCDVTGGVITAVHVRDPAVLDRMPIDGTHALLARFGDPDRPPQDVGAQMFVLGYAGRGIDVRWDDGVQHLDEVTLHAPRAPR